MRKFGAVLFAMACCAFVPIAIAGDAFVGDWEVKQEFRGQERVSTISITEGEDGLSGSWISQRGTTELSDVSVKDGTITFVRKMERQGQEFEINYEASIVDGKLVGKMITSRGEREFTGIAIGAEPTFLGLWDVEFEYSGNTVEAKLDVVDEDGKLAGTWSSERGDGDLSDVAINDGELTFGRVINMQGQEISLAYSAKIEDGKLVGTIDSPMGKLPFTGTLAKAEEDDSEAGRALAMLKQIDSNNDGKITEDEAPEQMKQFFSMIDSNGDGHIDAEEMIMVIQFMAQQG